MSNRITPENAAKIQSRLNGSIKTRILLESDRSYRCEECSNDGFWMGKKIVLQVDHIDGDSMNNDPRNMRFLCPNCHSQTETFGFKGRKHSEETKRKISLRVSKSRPQQR